MGVFFSHVSVLLTVKISRLFSRPGYIFIFLNKIVINKSITCLLFTSFLTFYSAISSPTLSYDHSATTVHHPLPLSISILPGVSISLHPIGSPSITWSCIQRPSSFHPSSPSPVFLLHSNPALFLVSPPTNFGSIHGIQHCLYQFWCAINLEVKLKKVGSLSNGDQFLRRRI